MLTLHTCRPLPREAPPPRVRAHDAERLQVPEGNCIKIGLPGKLIPRDYFQENRTSRRPFPLLRISFPGRPIFIQLVPVVLEEDLVRVADVGGVGVEFVGGDAVPGRLHAMALRDRRIDALRPLTLVQLQQIDTTEFPIPSCREVFGKVLGRSPAMLGQ